MREGLMHNVIALADLPLAELEKKYLQLVTEVGTYKNRDVGTLFCFILAYEVAAVIDDLRAQIGMGA